MEICKQQSEIKMRHLSKARENAIVEYLDYQIPVTQRKNAIIEYLDYQIPVTQLKGQKGNGDMKAAKRD